MSAYFKDLAERVVWTFVQATLAGVVVAQYTDADMWLAALSGGIAAALAVVKGAVASRVGTSGTASTSRDV